MRIISGSLRGKKLLTPQKSDIHIRPTADRAREALFNILNSRLEKPLGEIDVLDVFSGTGALGLEAASRGARSVTFVDLDLAWTKKNAALCGFGNLKFIQKDARFLLRFGAPFGLIFSDAPYNQGLTSPVLETLLKCNAVFKETLIVAETAAAEELVIPEGTVVEDERVYGAARFWFLSLKG